MKTKICLTCDEEKLESQFYWSEYKSAKQNKKYANYSSHCKKCANAHSARRARFRAYGITPEMLDDLICKQENKCAICDKELLNLREPCIDHNHSTGEVRGLLCRMCNLGLGHFYDTPDLLLEAYKYLIKYG